MCCKVAIKAEDTGDAQKVSIHHRYISSIYRCIRGYNINNFDFFFPQYVDFNIEICQY